MDLPLFNDRCPHRHLLRRRALLQQVPLRAGRNHRGVVRTQVRPRRHSDRYRRPRPNFRGWRVVLQTLQAKRDAAEGGL